MRRRGGGGGGGEGVDGGREGVVRGGTAATHTCC